MIFFCKGCCFISLDPPCCLLEGIFSDYQIQLLSPLLQSFFVHFYKMTGQLTIWLKVKPLHLHWYADQENAKNLCWTPTSCWDNFLIRWWWMWLTLFEQTFWFVLPKVVVLFTVLFYSHWCRLCLFIFGKINHCIYTVQENAEKLCQTLICCWDVFLIGWR